MNDSKPQEEARPAPAAEQDEPAFIELCALLVEAQWEQSELIAALHRLLTACLDAQANGLALPGAIDKATLEAESILAKHVPPSTEDKP